MSMAIIKNLITASVRPLRNRIYTMISRAVIESVNDSGGIQLVKLNLLAGENRSDVERFQNFGFTGNPPDGSECVAISVGGNRDHLIVVAMDDRKSRVSGLAKGESAQYNSNGDFIKLKANGNLEASVSKLKFENNSNELIDLLVQLADETAKGTTNTIFGPLKKNNALAIAALKIKLESFKV